MAKKFEILVAGVMGRNELERLSEATRRSISNFGICDEIWYLWHWNLTLQSEIFLEWVSSSESERVVQIWQLSRVDTNSQNMLPVYEEECV